MEDVIKPSNSQSWTSAMSRDELSFLMLFSAVLMKHTKRSLTSKLFHLIDYVLLFLCSVLCISPSHSCVLHCGKCEHRTLKNPPSTSLRTGQQNKPYSFVFRNERTCIFNKVQECFWGFNRLFRTMRNRSIRVVVCMLVHNSISYEIKSFIILVVETKFPRY